MVLYINAKTQNLVPAIVRLPHTRESLVKTDNSNQQHIFHCMYMRTVFCLQFSEEQKQNKIKKCA